MIEIGKLYLQRVEEQTRLCADVSVNGRGTTLWFGVETAQEAYLCAERSDAFVMALLPMAMRSGQDIACVTAMSERLHYQLEGYLIPSLAAAETLYRPVSVRAPLAAERVRNRGAVGTGFSGGVDSLYSVMTHGKESAYPLTHLALFDVGVFEGAAFRMNFRRSCDNARRFAAENGLELVALDSNLPEALPERFLDVYSFRNLAGAMALQSLFSVYLLSSGHDVAQFTFDLHNSATYDLLTVHCAQTESLAIYLSGSQVQRSQKLAALAEWPPSWRWLHPCVYGRVGEKNCGHCKKCARDMTTLYALGALGRYEAVFDLAAYEKALPQRMGFVLANRGNHLYDETLRLLEERNVSIPPAAYACEQQFRRAMKNLEEGSV
ncbi:MAG: hypothetical protein E7443_03930 [Ruminococcaceae bacterium]|nr:hypothetical protein [Oscillospiraceae bacterium]